MPLYNFAYYHLGAESSPLRFLGDMVLNHDIVCRFGEKYFENILKRKPFLSCLKEVVQHPLHAN